MRYCMWNPEVYSACISLIQLSHFGQSILQKLPKLVLICTAPPIPLLRKDNKTLP